ncbi:MAG: hypothetical protein KDB14_33625 [Planctomycetales bacterium]|nr:hypothetical protein [Planctomycetales bacterium]
MDLPLGEAGLVEVQRLEAIESPQGGEALRGNLVPNMHQEVKRVLQLLDANH